MAFSRDLGGEAFSGLDGSAFPVQGGRSISSPLDLTPDFWVRAGTTSSDNQTLDGSNNVQAATDRSGNGHSLSQGTAADRPAWSASAGPNSTPAWTFSTTDQLAFDTPWAQGTVFTGFIVFQANANGSNQILLQRSTSPTVGPAPYFSFSTNPSKPGVYYDAEGAGTFHAWGSTVTSNWHLLTFRVNVASLSEIAVDNGAFSTLALSANISSNWASIDLGSAHTFTGGIADIVIVKRSLSNADIAAIQTNYFKSRYALW